MSEKRLQAVDFFCGSGAVTTALKASGFDVLAAVDSDVTACTTYAWNHPEPILYQRDIKKLDPAEIDVPHGFSLLVVCAPCQPFSTHNRKKAGDPRARLVLESLRFIEAYEPKLVLFENVPGIAANSVFSELQTGLSKINYTLSISRTFNAADFGVAQRRIRCVLTASRNSDAVNRFNAFVPTPIRCNVADKIRTLSKLRSGESDPTDPLHRARNHKAIVLERLYHIPKNGGSRAALPEWLQLRCHKSNRKSGAFPDVYGRMAWDEVAPTLTTGCTDVTKGRFAHPEQDRAITLREAALLQGFPSNYRFAGSQQAIATQIGNAVPLGLITGLAPLMREMIASA